MKQKVTVKEHDTLEGVAYYVPLRWKLINWVTIALVISFERESERESESDSA